MLAARNNACGTVNGLLPGLYDGLCTGGNVEIKGLGDVTVLITNVIRIAEWFAGGLAVIAIIVAGIMYVTSQGEPANINRAKSVLTQAITGLVIIIIAYALVTYIASKF